MQVNRGYRFRIEPNAAQRLLLAKTFGCCRFVYNHMLADRKRIYEAYKDDPQTLRAHKSQTPAELKKDFEWLREVDSLALANEWTNLNAAYRNFFRVSGAGFPRFKSKHRDANSYTTFNQGGTVRLTGDGYIRLPKLGNVRIKLHRSLPDGALIKSATLRQTPSGRYEVSLMVEYTYEPPCAHAVTNPSTVLGLDYSSGSLFVDSQGEEADYPRYYRQMEAKLAKAQRKLSKRQRGGSNYRKQRRKVARLHEKVKNQRRDFLHKTSYALAEGWDAVAVEDLHLRGLAGSLRLGKSTMDNGYGMLRTMLAYKLADRGKRFVVVGKWYPSSKLCHKYGTRNEELTLADRAWVCSVCGAIHDRDVNAARNIRDEGIRILQRGTAQ